MSSQSFIISESSSSSSSSCPNLQPSISWHPATCEVLSGATCNNLLGNHLLTENLVLGDKLMAVQLGNLWVTYWVYQRGYR